MLLEERSVKEAFARQAYLLFFNRRLLERGLLDEKEYAALKSQILSKYGKVVHCIGR